MADSSPATSIIEGTVKFRDGKKWKSRWCVMRKLSPVAGMGKPKQHPQVKKKRAYTTQHSAEMLDTALKLLREKKISSYQAEKIFGIPRSTLLDKLHRTHPLAPGTPTRLTIDEEKKILKVLIAAGDYGCPLTLLDLRLMVHRYLENNGRIALFDGKPPGKKWAYSFIKRHKDQLTIRSTQNIKRSRAEKKTDEMATYFENLKFSLEGIPKENIINYDETNLSDNPGNQKCLFRRGIKYPERVLNYTKGAISIMFAITASGECLAPYVVYKAEHLYSQWAINGPRGARYNRTKSGWFDSMMFEDWFETIILPWASSKSGNKLLIGDNLASHINHRIVTLCEENDIKFVFLPPNSSHLTQPLDVCYFGPMKKLWRSILMDYKIKNPKETTINKSHFPELLKLLMLKLNDKTENILSAFKSTGIFPFNPEKVIKKLPDSKTYEYNIDDALLDYLKENRAPNPIKKIRNKKLNVVPGKSVSSSDFKYTVKLDFKIASKGKRTLLPSDGSSKGNHNDGTKVTLTSNILITPTKAAKIQSLTPRKCREVSQDSVLSLRSPPKYNKDGNDFVLDSDNKNAFNTTVSVNDKHKSLPGSSKNSLPWHSPDRANEDNSLVRNYNIEESTPKRNVAVISLRKTASDSDTDEDDNESVSRYSLLDPSDESNFILSESDNDSSTNNLDLARDTGYQDFPEVIKTDVTEKSWVLVKLKNEKISKYYIAQVLETLSPISYRVKFLRHKGKGDIFYWPVIDDLSVVSSSEIELVLTSPQKQRRGLMKFDTSRLKNLNIS